MFLKFSIFILCLFYFSPLSAGDITLNADERVEYHQKEQKLVAKGNAIATRDNIQIKADTLIGYYSPKASNKIHKVEAMGDVILHSSQATAYGNQMIYDTSTDEATLTGTPAKIKTPDTIITSDGTMIYYQTQQKAVATDNVIATDNKGNKVYADLMTAYFTKDSAGKMVLNKIDIEKNIKIISADTTVTALKGTYYASTGKIELFEDVVITQKGNILRGSKAETNLNTGISKILSGGSSGRVSGIFKEKKKKDN